MEKKMKKSRLRSIPWFSGGLLFLAAFICIIPFILVVSISFSSEEAIKEFGYTFIPREFDLMAYKYVFSNWERILTSYVVTTASTIIGTVLSVLIMGLMAYPLAQRSYRNRKPITFMLAFTMLFSGGLVPSYILITQYLHLKDNFLVLVIPSLVSAFHVILMRTFFQDISPSIRESAKVDGCSEFRILFQIIIPLSKPTIATIALLQMLARWGDWYTCLLYINNQKLTTLQYFMQSIMSNIELMKTQMSNLPMGHIEDIPTESARMAMAIITAGPMIFVFPFFQKYFVKGLTVGAVKG